jgi:hypothetical protein
MNKSIIINEEVKQHFSAQATLAALGVKVCEMKLFEPITQEVKIAQKTVKYTPIEKLMDAEIAILAGAHGMVEINKRVRPERGLQAAFGRNGCAEQSVVQDTLDACTEENVVQMQAALDLIYRQHSQGYCHNYRKGWQLLDADMTGRPCGKKATFATKGYFAKQRNRRGRQEGYLIATHYEEIVAKQLFDGKTQLTKALRPLVEAAEKTLGLDQDEEKRQRTILRMDSGGGSIDEVNWVLKRGYQFHGKDYSGTRAQNLAESVVEWFDDPRCPERQVGWVTEKTDIYCRRVKRVAVRCRKKNGQWGVGVLLSTLSPQNVLELTDQALAKASDPLTVLLAYVYFYDQRGGGVETEIKEDKQGLGSSKRNKKRFTAQHMLALLEALAHNLLVWARNWLAHLCPKVARFGMLRLVRDAFHLNGLIVLDQTAHVLKIVFNRADPLAKELHAGFSALFAHQHVAITLGET